MEDYIHGDLFEHEPSGAVFIAERDKTDSCEGCAGNVSRQMCDVLPVGCASGGIIWKPNNIEAKVLAVTLRLEE
jgi:small ligand-binding sensory domain FIST